jgi:ribosome-binding protein aMBF1 (putative translation factor)
MTTITCDLCGLDINGAPIKVELRDGEHPHCGSTMRTIVDCCVNCAVKIPNLESNAELDDVKKLCK